MDPTPEDSDDDLPPLAAPTWADSISRIGALELFEKYRQKVVHRETQLPFEPTRKRKAYTIERLAFETGWGMRLALSVFMPVCALFFLGSFFWDWHGLIRSCSVAGMIGFATNWVAIKMLFWPRQPRPVFGQGLIPSQRDQLIEKVADEVLENLINEELILQKVDETQIVGKFSKSAIEKMQQVTQDPEFKADLRRMILGYVAELTNNDEFRRNLREKVESGLEDVAGEGVRRWAVRKLKGVWRGPLSDVINKQIEDLDQTVDEGLGHMDEVLERLPEALAKRQDNIDQVLTKMLIGLVREVDVRQIVLDQLETVTVEQLERGFREFSDDKLSFITLLGGILGVVGGTVIVWPLPSLLVIGGLLGLMVVVDVIARPLMESRFWPSRQQ